MFFVLRIILNSSRRREDPSTCIQSFTSMACSWQTQHLGALLAVNGELVCQHWNGLPVVGTIPGPTRP